MNILGVLKGGEKLVSGIGEAFDKNFTNAEERLNAKTNLLKEFNSHLTHLYTLQSEVIKIETQGNKLQRSWRPIVMLAFAFIVVYAYFIQPAFFPNQIAVSETIPPYFWDLLKIGLGGYVIGRSGEKIAKEVIKMKR